MQCFQNAQAYFATVVSYASKNVYEMGTWCSSINLLISSRSSETDLINILSLELPPEHTLLSALLQQSVLQLILQCCGEHRDTQHKNDTKPNDAPYWVSHNVLMLYWVSFMLSVAFSYCLLRVFRQSFTFYYWYAECRYFQCHYTERCGTVSCTCESVGTGSLTEGDSQYSWPPWSN